MKAVRGSPKWSWQKSWKSGPTFCVNQKSRRGDFHWMIKTDILNKPQKCQPCGRTRKNVTGSISHYDSSSGIYVQNVFAVRTEGSDQPTNVTSPRALPPVWLKIVTQLWPYGNMIISFSTNVIFCPFTRKQFYFYTNEKYPELRLPQIVSLCQA